MVCLGIYLQYKQYLDRMEPPVQAQYTWFPVICIFAFTICCTVGYLVVPWVSINEIPFNYIIYYDVYHFVKFSFLMIFKATNLILSE